MKLESLPYLEASIEDFHEALSKSREISPQNKRHSVLLLEEAFEFVLYQKLTMLGVDIYKSGQNTIGTDKAIELTKELGISLLFLDSIRKVLKLRGDAKHHAQVPTDKEYLSLLERLRVSYSAFVFENFSEDLGDTMIEMHLVPYDEALRIHGEHLKSHQPQLACRQVISAIIHKTKAVIGDTSLLRTWLLSDITDLLAVLDGLMAKRTKLPMSAQAAEATHEAMLSLTQHAIDANYVQAYDEARKLYALLDETLPSFFDLQAAVKLTDRLVVPESVRFAHMGWSGSQGNDTDLHYKLARDIRELLTETPELVEKLGDPEIEYEEDNIHTTWTLAVFDGDRWHSVLLLGGYLIAPESGDWDNPLSGQRRESVVQAVYNEMLKARDG